MATDSHYPLPSLPWQADHYDDFYPELYSLRLFRRGDVAPLVILVIKKGRISERWSWSILPVVLSGPARRSVEPGNLSRDTCELELTAAVKYWLGAPPSAYLPPQEGATGLWKEV